MTLRCWVFWWLLSAPWREMGYAEHSLFQRLAPPPWPVASGTCWVGLKSQLWLLKPRIWTRGSTSVIRAPAASASPESCPARRQKGSILCAHVRPGHVGAGFLLPLGFLHGSTRPIFWRTVSREKGSWLLFCSLQPAPSGLPWKSDHFGGSWGL